MGLLSQAEPAAAEGERKRLLEEPAAAARHLQDEVAWWQLVHGEPLSQPAAGRCCGKGMRSCFHLAVLSDRFEGGIVISSSLIKGNKKLSADMID